MNYICYFKRSKKYLRHLIKEPVVKRWLYLGNNYDDLALIKEILGEEKQFKVGAAFHTVANATRARYIDYIARLSKRHHTSRVWWASSLASKSPYLSQLFKLICYQKLIGQLMGENDGLVVLVSDAGFFRHLKNTSRLIGCRYLGGPGNLCAKMSIKSLLIRIKLAYYLARHKFRVWNWPDGDLARAEILLFSWVQEHSFDKNNNYLDNTLGKLKEHLIKKGHNVKRFTYMSYYKLFFDRLKQSKEEMIIDLKHVSFLDIFKAVLSVYAFKYDGNDTFDNLNISYLLKREIMIENANPDFFCNLVFYFGVKKIVRKAKAMQFVVHPYEGQPWEKMLYIAVKNIKPSAKVIGYQHSAFSSFYMSHFLGEGESAYAPAPDLLLANSVYNEERLIAGGFLKGKVKNIGALRYEYLFDRQLAEDTSAGNKNNSSILICLPYDLGIAADMLISLMPYMTKLMRAGAISGVLVKSHPLAPMNISDIEGGAEFLRYARHISGQLGEVIAKVDIVIYCNGAVGVEAAFLGKNILKYLPEIEIDLDPLPFSRNVVTFSNGEFENAWVSLMSRDNNLIDSHNTSKQRQMLDQVNYGLIDEIFVNMGGGE